MQRLTDQRVIEAVAEALTYMPRWLRPWLDCDVCTEDPVFVGLHHYVKTDDGRLNKETAHVAYRAHMKHMPRARRKTTMVLPGERGVQVILHEFGHVLHANLCQHVGCWDRTPDFPVPAGPSMLPESAAYYDKNRWERFAGAFESWFLPEPGRRDRDPYWSYFTRNPAVFAFFDNLPRRP